MSINIKITQKQLLSSHLFLDLIYNIQFNLNYYNKYFKYDQSVKFTLNKLDRSLIYLIACRTLSCISYARPNISKLYNIHIKDDKLFLSKYKTYIDCELIDQVVYLFNKFLFSEKPSDKQVYIGYRRNNKYKESIEGESLYFNGKPSYQQFKTPATHLMYPWGFRFFTSSVINNRYIIPEFRGEPIILKESKKQNIYKNKKLKKTYFIYVPKYGIDIIKYTFKINITKYKIAYIYTHDDWKQLCIKYPYINTETNKQSCYIDYKKVSKDYDAIYFSFQAYFLATFIGDYWFRTPKKDIVYVNDTDLYYCMGWWWYDLLWLKYPEEANYILKEEKCNYIDCFEYDFNLRYAYLYNSF